MKKVLFFLALCGSMIAAQAQVKLVYNDTEYNNGESVPVMLTQDDFEMYDSVLLVRMKVLNESESVLTIDITATIESGEGYEVESFCAGGTCQPGTTCPAFSVDPGTLSDWIYPEFRLNPSHMNAQGTAVAKLEVRNTRSGEIINTTYLALTFENPLGIEDGARVVVKVFPNPTTSLLNVDADADEVMLTDLSGKCVLRQRMNGNAQINVEGLAKGMYVLNTIKGGQVSGSQKVAVR